MSETAPHAALRVTPLNTALIGSRIIILDQADSTNDYALRIGGDGTLVIAERQTAGRGRHGRAWESPPGSGLWFSVAFEGDLRGLPMAAALAVRDALKPICPVEIKWPNDLLVRGKKVCGILVEHRHCRTALGIGINVHQRPEDFSEELREKATSLDQAAGKQLDREEVLRQVLTRLDERVIVLRSGKYEHIQREWADACDAVGRRIRYDAIEGLVTDIDEHGALVVMTDDGERRVISGEVEVM